MMPVPAPSSPPTTVPARTTATDREACEFLVQRILPGLRSETHRPLASALRTATRSGRLSELAALPERQRRELLDVIERRLDLTPGSATPRVVVRLTSVVAGISTQERETRRLAAPAR